MADRGVNPLLDRHLRAASAAAVFSRSARAGSLQSTASSSIIQAASAAGWVPKDPPAAWRKRLPERIGESSQPYVIR